MSEPVRELLAISLSLLACAACGVSLGDGASNGLGTDASPAPGDAGPDPDPTPDAQVCANGRVVYLNFGGVTLTRGSPSDATQNRASWMNITQGTAPPYKSGVSNRAQLIQDVTDGVRSQLSIFPVSVVTQRPATGPYVMIVFGGVANQVGSSFGGAVQRLDCGDVNKSDLAWISDGVTPTQRVVNFAVGAIGFGLGLTATSDPNDCMCGWDNQCTSNNTAACKLSPMINRDPNANQLCSGLTTQDEIATFTKAFCQ
jgi:hypothetical protein